MLSNLIAAAIAIAGPLTTGQLVGPPIESEDQWDESTIVLRLQEGGAAPDYLVDVLRLAFAGPPLGSETAKSLGLPADPLESFSCFPASARVQCLAWGEGIAAFWDPESWICETPEEKMVLLSLLLQASSDVFGELQRVGKEDKPVRISNIDPALYVDPNADLESIEDPAILDAFLSAKSIAAQNRWENAYRAALKNSEATIQIDFPRRVKWSFGEASASLRLEVVGELEKMGVGNWSDGWATLLRTLKDSSLESGD